MHGIIFAEFRKFLEGRHGPRTWATLSGRAGLGSKLYLPTADYPDIDFVSLLSVASRFEGRHAEEVLEDFGQFVVPDLIRLHARRVDPSWRTLEFLLNTELAIYTVVRATNPQALPPGLKVARTGVDEVTIHYRSPRKMCAFAKGIIRGAANHYRESVKITEDSCMLKGGEECEIKVTLVG